jgi:hypothetical protein
VRRIHRRGTRVDTAQCLLCTALGFFVPFFIHSHRHGSRSPTASGEAITHVCLGKEEARMQTPTSALPQEMTGGAGRREAWAHEAVTSPETTRQAQMGKLFGYLKGLHATHLIDVDVQLGLFRQLALAPAGLSPEALACAGGLHPPYVRLWCETACALELLDYAPQTGYRLAPYMDELLGQLDSTFYLGRFPETHLLVARDYARYPDLFRSGGVHPYQAHDARFLQSVAEATQSLPRMFLDAILPKLPDLQARLEAGARLLDVGCGGGYALVAFAERFPHVRGVGLDVEPTSNGIRARPPSCATPRRFLPSWRSGTS